MSRERPDTVPADAEWDEGDQEWVIGPRDEDGEYHGEVTYYRPDGSLLSKANHVHGVVEGVAKRFHPNGEVAQIANYKNGKIHGLREWFACAEPTPEAFYTKGMSRDIVHAQVDYNSSRTAAFRYYLADGTQVEIDGKPVRQRPDGVPENAIWFPGTKLWMTGDWDEAGKRVGELWAYYEDGTLAGLEHYEDDKAQGLAEAFRTDGTLRTRRSYNEGLLEGVLEYFDREERLSRRVEVHDGTWASPLTDFDPDEVVRVQELPDISSPQYAEPTEDEKAWLFALEYDTAPPDAEWSPAGMARLIAAGWCGDEDRDHTAARVARRIVRNYPDKELQAVLAEIGLDRAPRLFTPGRAQRLVLALQDIDAVDATLLKAAMVDEGGVGDVVGLLERGHLPYFVLKQKLRDRKVKLIGLDMEQLPTELRLLVDLTCLYAQDCGLKRIGTEVSDLVQLRDLRLDGNRIEDITDDLALLYDLTSLNLARNALTQLPEVVGNLPALKNLTLGYNAFTSLPDSFGNLTTLRQLWINNTRLQTLPDSFANLQQLHFLHCTDHHWTTPPECIWELDALETLWLPSKSLEHLPEDVGRLKNLNRLVLWHSNLTKLPDALFEMTHLEEIRIKHNPLPEGTMDALKEALPNCTIY